MVIDWLSDAVQKGDITNISKKKEGGIINKFWRWDVAFCNGVLQYLLYKQIFAKLKSKGQETISIPATVD